MVVRHNADGVAAGFCLAAITFLLGLVAVPPPAHAIVECQFDRDLSTGVIGEDVNCLQRYLNDAGYILAEGELGAPGQETEKFGALTREALSRWQAAHNVAPASGYFGPLSRAKYEELRARETGEAADNEAGPRFDATGLVQEAVVTPADGSGNVDSPSGTSVPLTGGDDPEAVVELLRSLGLLDEVHIPGDSAQAPAAAQATEANTRSLIEEAIDEIEDAEEAVDAASDSDDDVTFARRYIEDARDDLFDAVAAYFADDLADAFDSADDARDLAENALEILGGTVEDDDTAADRLERIEKAYDDAWDSLYDALDDGYEVGDAEDDLREAGEELERAEDALEDGRHGFARDLLEEIDELIEQGLDKLAEVRDDDDADGDAEDDAEDAIESAREALDAAEDAIDDAADDGEDTDRAEELLEEGRDLLDDADDAFDDEDFDMAIDRAEEAEDYAENARDEI